MTKSHGKSQASVKKTWTSDKKSQFSENKIDKLVQKKTQTREKTDKLIKSDKLVTKSHNLVKIKVTN